MTNENLHIREGENIEKTLHPHFITFLVYYLIGGLFLTTIVLGIIIILIVDRYRKGIHYIITDTKIIEERTFLSKKVSIVRYENIRDIYFTQNIFERFFGVGTVHINTAGSSQIEIRFRGVENPNGIFRMIDNHMKNKKQE